MATETPAEFSELLSGEMVDIYVGPKRKHWHLPKLLLCNTSSFFQGSFEGEFKEAAEKALYLPEDEAEGFEIFVQWLYRGGLPGIANYATFDAEQLLSSNIALYHLADKLCIVPLQNLAIERIGEIFKRGKQVSMRPSTILGIYQNTRPDSMLRKLSVDLAAHRYMSTPDLNIEYYKCCLDSAEGFVIDLVRAMKANMAAINPLKNVKSAIPRYQYRTGAEKAEKTEK
ncbi:MAG: hypothetical protein M1812_006984 [Candelaria pacifica]|nr:MAG: hypothetical protein M1812_006984 [Candelaria pacifica]